MKIQLNEPPREYQCGFGPAVTMKDCAHIELAADEQITLVTEQASEYDVVSKDWGFYATPSINSRLNRFGLTTILAKNRIGHYFVLLLEEGKESEFDRYVQDEGLTVCGELNDETLPLVEQALQPCKQSLKTDQ